MYNAVIIIKILTLFLAVSIGYFYQPVLVAGGRDMFAVNFYLFLLVGVFPWTYGPVLYACCSRSAGTSTLFNSLGISAAGACMSYLYIAGQCTQYSGWGWGNVNTDQFCLWQQDAQDLPTNVTGNWKQGQIQLGGALNLSLIHI